MTVETTIVAVVVGAAVALLALRLYRSFRPGDQVGCGSCGCHTGDRTETEVLGRRIDLVQIGVNQDKEP